MSPAAFPAPSPRRLWALRGVVLAMVLALVSALALVPPPPGMRQGPAAPGERLTDTVLFAALAVVERQSPALPKGTDADPGTAPAPVLPVRVVPGATMSPGPGDGLRAQRGDPSRRPRAPPAHPD